MKIAPDNRCLQILKDMFGELEPKQIKFKTLEKGTNKINIINPIDTSFRHFSAPNPPPSVFSFDPSTPIFLFIGHDNPVQIRILSEPISYYQSFQINSETKKCRRYLTHVIDRDDNKVKVWSFGIMLANKIREQQLQNNVDPFNQDVVVTKCLRGICPSYNISFCSPSTQPVLQLTDFPPLRSLIESSPRMSFSP